MKPLQLVHPAQAYRPQFTDPRVIKRITSVLDWCDLHLSSTKARPVSATELRKVFGNAGTSDLAAYLSANLLIQTGQYIVGHATYSYLLNDHGVQKLRTLLASQSPNAQNTWIDKLGAKHADELATGQFNMELKSDRYWHGLQNIKRERKAAFWSKHGYGWNYDIEACAPTVLQQLAMQLGLPPILCDHVQAYLDDREGLREHVATLAGLHPDDAKRLVNSLFNGAQLSSSPYCSAFQLLGYDQAKMQALQQDQRLRALRLNIKLIWGTIERSMNVSLRKSKVKWSQYFKVEHRILQVIKAEAADQGARLFTEHDGFWSNRELDLNRLVDRIKTETGLSLKLKCEQVG